MTDVTRWETKCRNLLDKYCGSNDEVSHVYALKLKEARGVFSLDRARNLVEKRFAFQEIGQVIVYIVGTMWQSLKFLCNAEVDLCMCNLSYWLMDCTKMHCRLVNGDGPLFNTRKLMVHEHNRGDITIYNSLRLLFIIV